MAANPFDKYDKPAGNYFDKYDPGAKPANTDGQAVSGFKRSFQEVPGMLAGVGAFAADVVGADGARDSMLAYAKRKSDEVGAAHAGDAQSLTDAWDGKVSWGDFLANAAGYVAGQALQSIVTGGVGALGAKMLANNGIKQIGVKVAAEQIAAGATEEIAKAAAIKAMTEAGSKAAVRGGIAGATAQNMNMELGSIYPDAVEEAGGADKLDNGDRFRVLSASALAAGVDTAGEALTAFKWLKGSTAGGTGILGRAAREVPAGMAREAGTEAIQTGIEQWGANKALDVRDIVDSAGVGAVGGAMAGGGASLRKREAEKQPEPKPDPVAAVLAAPDVDTAIKAAAESLTGAKKPAPAELPHLIPTADASEFEAVPAGDAAELDVETIQPADLMARDGQPFGSNTGAQAKAYASGGGKVVAIPNHFGSGIPGYVVRPLMQARPNNTRGTNAGDVPQAARQPAAAPAPAPAPAQPTEGPGSDAGNGFKRGPKDGERYRVGVVAAAGGAIVLEKRLPAGTSATFYVGKDGGLIDSDNVNFIGNDRDRLWIPGSPEQAQQAQQILDEMGRLALTDPARKDAKARLKALVQGKTNVETIQPTDLMARDGQPFGSNTGAQAKAYASGGGKVVAIPNHFGSGIPGYVVRPLMQARPNNTRGTNAGDVPQAARQPAAAPAPAPAPAQPTEGPGSDAGNGFKRGPKDGERYRVGVVAAAGGAIVLEKRLPAGTSATFYVGKDGGLIDSDNVNFIGNDRDRLWIPGSPEQAQQAQQILDEMGRLALTDPARKDAKARLKALVQGKTNVETIQPTDLMARDGQPFGSNTGAQAKAYASGGGKVVAIPNHFGSGIPGYVVRPLMQARPNNTRGTNAGDVPQAARQPAAAPAPAPAPAQPTEGPGSDAGNGFKRGPKDGERYRVGVVAAAGGAIVLEKRLPAGTSATFYVGKDGGLIDSDNVNFIGNDRDRLWIPGSPEQAQQAQQILDEMGRLALTDPARKDAKARLKALVQGKTNVETIQPTDLMARDGQPFGSNTGAQAKAYASGGGKVVAIPNHFGSGVPGYVVRPLMPGRPSNTRGTDARDLPRSSNDDQRDLAGSAEQVPGASDGRGADAARSGGAVGLVPAAPGRVDQPAEAPSTGNRPADVVAGAGDADTALTPGSRVTLNGTPYTVTTVNGSAVKLQGADGSTKMVARGSKTFQAIQQEPNEAARPQAQAAAGESAAPAAAPAPAAPAVVPGAGGATDEAGRLTAPVRTFGSSGYQLTMAQALAKVKALARKLREDIKQAVNSYPDARAEYAQARGEAPTASGAVEADGVKPRKTLQEARADAALDKQVRENGEVLTRRQWVERKVAEGLKTKVTQEDRIKPMSRMAYFRANNEEQRAHDRRVKEAGKKDVFWIGDYEVTKTEHDYANALASPPNAEAPVQAAPRGAEAAPVAPAPAERTPKAQAVKEALAAKKGAQPEPAATHKDPGQPAEPAAAPTLPTPTLAERVKQRRGEKGAARDTLTATPLSGVELSSLAVASPPAPSRTARDDRMEQLDAEEMEAEEAREATIRRLTEQGVKPTRESVGQKRRPAEEGGGYVTQYQWRLKDGDDRYLELTDAERDRLLASPLARSAATPEALAAYPDLQPAKPAAPAAQEPAGRDEQAEAQALTLEAIPKSLQITLEVEDEGGKVQKKVVGARRAYLAAQQRVQKLQALKECVG